MSPPSVTSLLGDCEKILRLAPVGVFICLPSGDVRYVNEAMARLTGDDSPEALLERVRNLGTDILERAPEMSESWSGAEGEGKVWEFEAPIRRVDGGSLWISVRMRALEDERGRIRHYLGFCRDFSGARAMAGALQESMARNAVLSRVLGALLKSRGMADCCHLVLEAALELTTARRGLVAYVDPRDGNLRSPSVCRAGWGGARGEDGEALLAATQGLWGAAVEERRPVLSNQPAQDPRLEAMAGGEDAARNVLAVPALLGEGDMVGLVLLLDAPEGFVDQDLEDLCRLGDIFALAAHRQLEAEASHRARAAAEAANQAKSRLLANLSHEVRTPLAGIIGLVDTLSREGLPLEHREAMQVIRDSADHLRRLLGDMLDFSRLEAGKVALAKEHFHLHRLLRSLTASLETVARQKGLALTLEIHPDTEDCLHGDPIRLGQVLVNLVSNAIKFTESGGVVLRVSPFGAQGCRVAMGGSGACSLFFSVQDTGMGIPESLQDKIFDRFAQADESYARKYGGAGLGLSICRQLVRLMGGRIWVESELGVGSTFYFTALLERGDICQMPAAPEAIVPASRALQVLVAEDNPVNALVARRFLSQLGHEAVVAGDGHEVLEVLSASVFDVIFMDLEMPEMDGVETARRIRAGEAGGAVQGIPIIALTAHAMAEHHDSCLAAGMQGYLTKPLELHEIKAVLDALPGLSSEPSALAVSGAPGAPGEPGEHGEPGEPGQRGQPLEPRGLRDVGGLRDLRDLRDLRELQDLRELGERAEAAVESGGALNRQVVWERLAGDAELFEEMLCVFVEDIPKTMDQLGQASRTGNLELAALLAHQLKSAAAAVGAETTRDLAVRLEHAARERRGDQVTQLLSRLEQALEEVQAVARELDCQSLGAG